jgi:predicted ATP-grasp superfamily ATP-dependent carboligase
MRIFVFEYITGGGMLGAALPYSLAKEGDLMLRALVSDLLELEDVELIVTRDARLEKPDIPVEFRILHADDDFPSIWQECIESADAVWPIAPENFRILEHISEAVIRQEKLLLNSSPEAVKTAASKIATSKLLEESGVVVVPTYRPEEGLPDRKGSWVLKPDDGVGCQGTSICRDRDDLYRQYDRLPIDRPHVAQPFVYGDSASLNMLVHRGEVFLLSINRQRVAITDNGFVLLGCVVNGLVGQKVMFQRIGQDIVDAMPGLWGHIGVDMMDTGEGFQVLEVNPRLTTSYVGLKESTGVNLAGLTLGLLNGKRPALGNLTSAKAVDVDLEYAGAA